MKDHTIITLYTKINTGYQFYFSLAQNKQEMYGHHLIYACFKPKKQIK